MDLSVIKSQVAGEARAIAHTAKGRAWMAEHFGAGAVEATIPRDNVVELLRSASKASLQWSRSLGTVPSDVEPEDRCEDFGADL